MQNLTRGLTLCALAAVTGCGGGEARLETFQDSASYAVGANIGNSMKREGVDIGTAQLMRGITDALSESGPVMDEAQLRQLLTRLVQQTQQTQHTRSAEEGAMNAAAGKQFLEDNGKRPGVTTTASGLQYEVVKQGNGRKPRATDVVTVNYRGTLIDGTEFDATNEADGPVSFPLNQVIPGWTEGVQLMNTGSVYKFYIPGELAYGAMGSPPVIGPNATLIFEVELVSIQ